MALVNRDKDSSEQIVSFQNLVTTTVGASAANSYFVAQAPFPGTLKAFSIAAQSVSGAPVVSLGVARFTAAGATTIAYVGTTLTVQAHGTSAAYQTVTLATAGSTLLNLQAGDVIVLKQEFSGGNVSAAGCVVTTCIQASQDIKKHFGV